MATQWEYSALWTNEDEIAYSIFRRDGRHQQSNSYSLDLWSECLAILGEIGWEAIAIQGTSDPDTTTWWFKRAISPSNDNLRM
jgi:hypothetical protein